MLWFLIFFISTLPTAILAYVDFVNHGFNWKSKKTFLLFFIAVGVTGSIIYTPLEHIDSENQIKDLKKEGTVLKENYKALQTENQLLAQQNEILKSRVELLNSGFDKYRKQIMKFNVFINIRFMVETLDNISSQSVIPAPSAIYLSVEGFKGARILFQTQDNSYSYRRIGNNLRQSVYNFSVHSEVIDGKFPLGMPLTTLKDYQFIRTYVPVFKNYYLNDTSKRKVTILSQELTFTINGKQLKKLSSHRNVQTITSIGQCHYADRDEWFCNHFPLKNNLYSALSLTKF